jgi:hypothetical protein
LLATTFTTFTYYGPEWVAYVIGGIGILGGIFFWYRRATDKGYNIWWDRITHGSFWFFGGITIVVANATSGTSTASIAVGVVFYADVLYGIGTALFRSSNPWHKEEGRFITFESASCFGADDQRQNVITPWSAAHFAFTCVAGATAWGIYYSRDLDDNSLWAMCLVASFAILLWEGFENTNLDRKYRWFNEPEIDSDANMLGDIVIGFATLWGTAYILKAAVA